MVLAPLHFDERERLTYLDSSAIFKLVEVAPETAALRRTCLVLDSESSRPYRSGPDQSVAQ